MVGGVGVAGAVSLCAVVTVVSCAMSVTTITISASIPATPLTVKFLLRYYPRMSVPATTRIIRTFDDRADALAHFFQRAGEAPRLIAYDDAIGLPLDQALAALEWTA